MLDNNDRGLGRSHRRRLMAGAAAVAATALLAVSTVSSAEGPGRSELASVRAATAQFHRVEQAEAAGHQLGYVEPFLLNGCISHPTDGAMGYHWFDHAGIADVSLDPLDPEGLVYAPGPNGQLRLVAVEWIVPKAAWEAAGNVDPPSVLGHELHVLNPDLGWYILHAWVWRNNPSGMFNDWNPEIVCP